MRCRYNAVNFLTNFHKRHPIARPLGRAMGCLLWIQHLFDILPEFLQSFMQYLIILDRVITALDYILGIQSWPLHLYSHFQQTRCLLSEAYMWQVLFQYHTKPTMLAGGWVPLGCQFIAAHHAHKDMSKGASRLAITGITILIPFHIVKSLQPIWRSGTQDPTSAAEI